MGWLGWLGDRLSRSRGAPMDVAERLTGRSLFRVDSESVPLNDRATVQRWLRELRPEHDEQILVHRSWGTIVAVADRRGPVSVFLADDENKAWFAAVRGASDEQPLTPEQLEHVMVDALTSPGPPRWPEWRYLV